jgi:DNA phosphorothioation-dependent restriction protein DptH
MSGQFERRFAEHVVSFLDDRPPRGGQILLAKFHNQTVTNRFAEALVDMASGGPPLKVGDEAVELPVINSDGGVPLYVVRVVSEPPEDPPDHVVVQGFATKMRNLIADSAQSNEPRAMLMVMDTESTLDTLDASEDLLADDGPVNLDSFRQSLLDPEQVESLQGRALFRGLSDLIGSDAMYAEDTAVLETLAELRDAVEQGRYDELPDLIGQLPQFIREDFFTEEKLSGETDEDDLTDAIVSALKDNTEHADRLRRAHRAGTDTQSRLESNYDETFVNKVVEAPDWSQIDHSEARKRTKEQGVRRFDTLEIEAKRQRIYGSLEDTSKTRKAIFLVANAGDARVTAEFTGDVGDTPFECVDPNGDEIGRTAKRENRVSVTFEGMNPDAPAFARFQFYVGKKTTRGKPTHQFDIAIVPEWFYHATEDVTLDIDVEEEALLAPSETPLELTPSEHLDFVDEPQEIEVSSDGMTVQFTGSLTLHPNPPGVVERLTCWLAPPTDIPIRIDFLSEAVSAEPEEVTLPLMLGAIEDPDRWAEDQFKLPDVLNIDTSRGEIHSSGDESVRIEDETLELIQIEERIIEEQSPMSREVDGDTIDYGTAISDTSELPSALMAAYSALFEHFDERGRTPSTDRWGDETKRLVRDVLDEYGDAVDTVASPNTFGPYQPLRNVGTIQSTATNKLWLTPFHPLILAYGLRIAEWRDEELVGHASYGFRREEFVSKFTPSGLLPYRTSSKSEHLLRAMRFRENPLWQVYSPVEAPGSVTPSYMERVIRDKLYTFMEAFPSLFSLHPERHLVVNLANLGDLRPVVKGLYEFYRKVENTDWTPPTILLRVYGGDGEGDALDRFFTESADSRLRVQLEKKNDELVDLLRTKIHYVHAGEYVEQNQKPAHLTFFRGLLDEQAGIMSSSQLPSGALNGGLFPRESLSVDQTSSSETVYTVGFSCDTDEQDRIHRVARRANALEAGMRMDSYQEGQTIKKSVTSVEGTDIGRLWDQTIWAAHVQPNVGLEFYLRSNTELQQDASRVMIHYSDQYDSSSPNYDVITSTNKREPYLLSLSRALEEADLASQLDPELILSRVIAIDGELALQLQRASDTELVEFVGFVGGLALSRQLLIESAPSHVWIPISLNELVRHDRAYQGGQRGVLQFDTNGKASDDLCFVGVPTDPDDSELQLWLVETKGGSSQISTGREQIEGALENFRQQLTPQQTYADELLLRGEFGKIVVDVARRMYNYDILDDEEFETLIERERSLIEGDFTVNFLEDENGHVGEVIRIRSDTLVSTVSSDGSVRAIEAPLKTLELLDGSSIETTLPDLDLNGLRFDVPATSCSETTQPSKQNQQQSDPSSASGSSNEQPSAAASDEVKDVGTETESDTPETTPSNPAPEPTNASNTASGSEETATADSASASDDEQSSVEPTQAADAITDHEAEDSVDTVQFEGSSREDTENDNELPAQTASDQDTDTEPHSSFAEDISETTQQNGPSDTELEQTDGRPEPTTSRPPSTLINRLEHSPEPESNIDPAKLASDLKQALDSLGVNVHPPNPSTASVGPRKIGINVLPKEGQKVEGILRNLDTVSVQIQAQGDIVGTRIPSKGAVRLEIPHGDPRDIYLRDGLEALPDSPPEALRVPVGVDTENTHHTLSLTEERHALIGGATGSGKSNFLSTIVSSLALTQSPDDLTISLLDPKGVDFGRFASLPHVQNGGYFDTPEACTNYLRSVVSEEIPDRKAHLRDANVSSLKELYENAEMLDVEKIPFHVIIIDEYADLVMSVDDVGAFEDAVTRLAQIGRALGIVVLLATQRPSADIVSGKIKANFPCRISFRLPSNTDSRVILDEPGAEDLQGSGDMLLHTQAGAKHNLQGYYLTPSDAMTVLNELSAKSS